MGDSHATRINATHAWFKCVRNEDMERTRRLLAAHPFLKDMREPSTGYTALLICARKGYTKLTKHLLQANANIDVKLPGSESTALHICAMSGQAAVMKMLIKSNVDVDVVRSDNSTPLLLAAKYNKVEIVRMLLKAGASLERRDFNGLSPLQAAKDPEVRQTIHNSIVRGEAAVSEDEWPSPVSVSSQSS
mmetsp:Transcript_23930/g.35871  ORF Transcript_23930/g.35871 Transcript_23930/m.35871 type:complete len:190 (+) Transcript_23930:62-631(+)